MIFPIDSSMSQCFYISPLLFFRNGFLKQTPKEHGKTISHIQSQTPEFVAGHHMGWGFSRSVVSDSFGLLDSSPPGSCVHGILQARRLEWVAMPFSRGYYQPRDGTHISFIGKQAVYHWATWEALRILGECIQFSYFLEPKLYSES